MLYALGELLVHIFGIFRLFQSHALLLGGGATLATLVMFILFPKYKHILPQDRGKVLVKGDGSKEYSIGAQESMSKPTGAGLLFGIGLLPIIFLFFPFLPTKSYVFWDYGVILCIFASMVFGYLDDKSTNPWSSLTKGIIDLVIALLAAFFLCEGEPVTVWLPLTTGVFTCPLWIYLPISTAIIWIVINSSNCSDGVDGLAGSLLFISIVFTALFLYIVIGHKDVASFLVIPPSNSAAKWAILGMIFSGGLAAYLWYNAYPSSLMMGDAGSRMLGTVLGVLIVVTGNPVVVFIVAPVILINGGTGLVKLGLLRLASKAGLDTRDPELRRKTPCNKPTIQMLDVVHRWRFPLHDHFRKKANWSPAQIMVRFVLIQIVTIPLLFLLLVKIR